MENSIKLLNAVFSFNRYFLFKNTIESFFEFGPGGDLLIVDDGSDDPRLLSYFQEIQKRGAIVIKKDFHVNDFHGGLYENMNRAVDYAIKSDYSHIFFLQDDVQFTWKDEQFLDRISRIFSACTDAAMILPIFQKGIVEPCLKYRMEPHPEAQCWHLTPYGICDIGIMPVSLFKERKWVFGKSEGENGKIWRQWGYKLYVPFAPILAWVPWPQVRIHNKTLYKERRPKEKYFLKPLTADLITQLNGTGMSKVPLHEDYCFPWKWRCLTPYWFTKGKREYISKLWKLRRWPKWVIVQ